MLVSEYIGKNHDVFNEFGILDTFIELDSNYYINICALKTTSIDCFKDSYNKIKNFFTKLYKLLNSYNETKNIVFYNRALEIFNFPEVNELSIGMSKGIFGKGLTSKVTRKKIIGVAKDLIKEGNKDPEMFLLLGVLCDRIGADLISDMISNIILNDIKMYTKEMNKKMFNDEEFRYNEYKKCYIYYIPKEIVNEIPLPRFMYEVDEAIRVNDKLRNYMNDEIGENFRRLLKIKKLNK